MLQNVQEILQLLIYSDDPLPLVSLYLFDVPRYFLATVSLGVGALQSRRLRFDRDVADISVVVALHNGEANFLNLIRGLASQTQQPREILVVDDGSTDHTRDLANHALSSGLIDELICHRTRCGKSASLNHGVRFANGELILVIDDDTALESTTLERLAAAFQDPAVAIASGDLSISNKKASLWTAIQSIEYLMSITMGRNFLNLFGAVACCSGALSMVRKSVLLGTGGYNVGPGEDLELTLRMHRLGFKVAHISEARASVDAPETFDKLLRQRLRWDRDAITIRLNMNQELDLRRPLETLSLSLARLDFIFFDFIPTIIFPIYIMYMMIFFEDDAFAYLSAIYLMIMSMSIINIFLSFFISGAKIGFSDLLLLPVFPFYQGVIMKFARFFAYSSEILFTTSRKDDFVPERVRRALYGELR